MMDVEEALEQLTRDVPCTEARTVQLHDALGRSLAGPVVAPLSVPPLDNSSMDGFALRAADCGRTPCVLRVAGTSFAGDPPAASLAPGWAQRIMTGAPMPLEGADAVVKIEDTSPSEPQDGCERVVIRCPVQPGTFVRRAGEDIPRGSAVFERGTVLNAARLGVLASLGLPQVEVLRRPRVAVLTTGDELVRPGQQPRPGQIFTSNTTTLLALIREAGGIGIDAGIVADDLPTTRAALRRASSNDLVVTTGGVSMGARDWVRVALEAEGAQLHFWKVAVKPGKPAAFGHLGGSRLFCLAGNPVSCTVGFYQWVRPIIRMMVADPAPHLPIIDAVSAQAVAKRPGRAWLERVVLTRSASGAICAERTGNQSSGVLSSLARAHGLMLLPRRSAGVDAGEAVRVMVLDWSFLSGPEPSYGW
jgi:molybdopterin molybdotransferase